MRTPLTTTAFLILLVPACHSESVKVRSYWGATTERPIYGGLYDWRPYATTEHSAEYQTDERLEQLVRQRVEIELDLLGFRKRTTEPSADYLVSIRMGRGFRSTPSGPEDQGTLALEFYDVKRRALAYLGWAETVVDPTLVPEERKARLERAVHDVVQPLMP